MRLEPQSQFALARGLEDHADSGTYYVQAVIRDAKTDEVLDTVNLTDRGSRRFTKSWLVPADPTGEGRDILITYTVYTDSGYTTKADNYGEKFADYRIEHIPKHHGGGADVDYKRVRQIVQDELAKLPKPEPVELPNLPFYIQPVLNALSGLRNDVAAIPTEPAKEPDLTGVQQYLANLQTAISGLSKQVGAIKIPETDLAPVLEAISSAQQAVIAQVQQSAATTGKGLTAALKNVQDTADSLLAAVKAAPVLVLSQNKPEEPKEEPINYEELLK